MEMDDYLKAQRGECYGMKCEYCGRLHGSNVPGKGRVILSYQQAGSKKVPLCVPCAFAFAKQNHFPKRKRFRKKTGLEKMQLDLFKQRKKKEL